MFQWLFIAALTAVVVLGWMLMQRFAFDRLRNSNSVKVMPGFEMKPSALVSGRVFVGFRRFAPLNPAVPEYSGPVASVAPRSSATVRLRCGSNSTWSGCGPTRFPPPT